MRIPAIKQRRTWLAAGLWAMACGPHAQTSAQDGDLAVEPTLQPFGVVALGQRSEPKAFYIHNVGSAARTLSTLGLGGPHADQFEIDVDGCSRQTLAAGDTCSVGVRFTPTHRGSLTATLEIPSDDPETPLLTAFVTNYEDTADEAQRRIPAVLDQLAVPEGMLAGQTYLLTWSLFGYEQGYTTNIVFFDCRQADAGHCGDAYADAARFAESGNLPWDQRSVGEWTFNGEASWRLDYSYAFTPDPARFPTDTDIVVRIYQSALDDVEGEKGSISLLIPGDLADRYYDSTGRRVVKTVCAAGGCTTP